MAAHSNDRCAEVNIALKWTHHWDLGMMDSNLKSLHHYHFRTWDSNLYQSLLWFRNHGFEPDTSWSYNLEILFLCLEFNVVFHNTLDLATEFGDDESEPENLETMDFSHFLVTTLRLGNIFLQQFPLFDFVYLDAFLCFCETNLCRTGVLSRGNFVPNWLTLLRLGDNVPLAGSSLCMRQTCREKQRSKEI